MFSILNPGDEVIVFAPFWVSYSAIITLADGIPKYINTTIKNDFKPTPEQLKKAITDKTKAIIFSSPCNPTGTVFTKSDLYKLYSYLFMYIHLRGPVALQRQC